MSNAIQIPRNIYLSILCSMCELLFFMLHKRTRTAIYAARTHALCFTLAVPYKPYHDAAILHCSAVRYTGLTYRE